MSKKKKAPENFSEIEKLFNPNFLRKLPDWQQEMVRFYAQRFGSYTKIPGQLAECRSPFDVFEVQSDFFNKLTSEYRNEAVVLSELLFDLPRSPDDEAKSPHEEVMSKAEKDAAHIVSLAKNQAELIIEAAEARADTILKDNRKTRKVA